MNIVPLAYATPSHHKFVDAWKNQLCLGKPVTVLVSQQPSWADACALKPTIISEALHKYKAPILYTDVDSKVNFLPDIPNGEWDLVIFPNPNPWHKNKYASGFLVVNYTDKALAFLERWKLEIREGEQDHPAFTRALDFSKAKVVKYEYDYGEDYAPMWILNGLDKDRDQWPALPKWSGVREIGYSGLSMQQPPATFYLIDQLLRNTEPSFVVELGGAEGALSVFIRDRMRRWFDPNWSSIITVDTEPVKDKREGIYYITGKAEASLSTIKEYADQYRVKDRPILWIFDAGWKYERRTLPPMYAPLMGDGDWCLFHDYAPTTKFFKERIKGNTWNWNHVTDITLQDIPGFAKAEPPNMNQCAFLLGPWGVRKVDAGRIAF